MWHVWEVSERDHVSGNLSHLSTPRSPTHIPGDEGPRWGAEEWAGTQAVEVCLVQVSGDQADVWEEAGDGPAHPPRERLQISEGDSSRRNSDCSAKPQERSSSISFSCRKAFGRGWGRDRLSSQSSMSSTPSSPSGIRMDTRDSVRTPTGSPYSIEHRIPHSTPVRSHRLTRSISTDESPQQPQLEGQACATSPSLTSIEPNRRVLRKTQSFDTAGSESVSWYGTCQRTLSEPARRGNTGVFIKGLEVSSTEVIDRPYSPRLPPMHDGPSVDSHRSGSPAPETRSKGRWVHLCKC